jgi:hypothetical protein
MTPTFVPRAEWPCVGGTEAGAYYQAESGVVVAVPRPRFVQTAEHARRSLDELYRIADEQGKPQVVLVIVDHVAGQDQGARSVWAREVDTTRYLGLGLVCRSLLSRAIGSFFIGLGRPTIPTRMFNNFEEALAWARRLHLE